MNKQEFIDKLRSVLVGRVAPALVEENVAYYEEYINTQIRMGRSEQEVLDSLGDPRLIAKTIIETSGQEQTAAYSRSDDREETGGYQKTAKATRIFRIPGWLLVLLVGMVVVAIISVVFTVLSALAPIIIIFFVVIFLVKLFRDWLN